MSADEVLKAGFDNRTSVWAGYGPDKAAGIVTIAATATIPNQLPVVAAANVAVQPTQMLTTNSEFDLPMELVQLGWRKFWSKRENRPYFWNKSTGESLWEVPVLHNNCAKPFDPVTDPLGIILVTYIA